ncbi:hypothetical protein TI39_contig687g00001 [Zymoseptoria brevis]|uniref:Uncharacterized protein n=1 Tax=Zymoseptoria brevis TaxID=1047168 RepID=A0A0F4GGU9_9PEZI|nr:hypothetical protein TI39_contig687g00001 [Zymoseptoria brevis]
MDNPQRSDLLTRYTILQTQHSPSHTRNPSTSSTSSSHSNDADLMDLTHALKSTLTDLLNCEAVKADAEWRSWCQARLMDAELELKRQRRRRVSSGGACGTASGEREEEEVDGRRESW